MTCHTQIVVPVLRNDEHRDVAVVLVCSALLLTGVFATLRWGALDVQPPVTSEGVDDRSTGFALRRYVRTLSLLLWTALITGVLIVGPVARLAMRLLAVTAGPAARGAVTEAEEVVGRISVDGTIGLFVFVGLFGAFIASLAYFVVRRWLPRGRLGGLVLGATLLVVAGTRLEPLRSNNEDFDLVGPAWLSIGVYTAMAILTGLAVVAVAGRLSRVLPLPERKVRTLLPHVVLLMLGFVFFLLPVVVLVGLAFALLQQTRFREVFRSKRVEIAGRIALALVVAIALPGFVASIVDIAGRGP